MIGPTVPELRDGFVNDLSLIDPASDTWYHLLFEAEDGITAVAHAVPARLMTAVIDDMVSRDCGSPSFKVLTAAFLDQPGMISTLRPIEEGFVLGGLTLGIPSEDIAAMLCQLEDVKMRGSLFSSDPAQQAYYKLHGFMRAIVLTPEYRNSLLEQLRAVLPAAEARATAFYAEHRLPSEVLREAAAKVNNIPLDKVPNLGANKQDRFKSRVRGRS